MSDPTREEIKAAIELMVAVADAIRALGRVPSGHLYAHLTGQLDLRTYQLIIDRLKRSGLVAEGNHELIWKGPKIDG